MLRTNNNDFGGVSSVTQTRKTSHFTPTDQRELYRDAVKQQSSNPFKLERVVNYDNMFTEQGSSYRFGSSHNYNPNYFPPKSFVKSGRNEPHIEMTLSGPDRYKFFHRPVVGPISENEFLSLPMNEKHIVYVTDKPLKAERDVSQEMVEEEEEEMTSQPRTREVGTQSIYRENETQTIPYFPPVKQKSVRNDVVDLNNPDSNQKERAVMPGSYIPEEMDPEDYPEYMKMHDLVFEDGRNGGFITEDHIKIVDRTRRRREVEDQLKKVGPNIDEEEFKNRIHMLKELEMLEWKEREEEIAKMQERQIEHVRAKIEVREQVREMKSSSRLESRLRKIREDTQEKLAKIEKKKLKNIRRTVKKYDNPENKLERRDILFEYAFPASRTYAPLLRDGQVSALTTIAYEIRPALLTDPLGVEEVQMNQVNKYLISENRALDKALPIRDKSGAVVVDPIKTATDPENRKQKVVREHLQLAIKDLEKLKSAHDIHDRVKEVKEMYKSTPRITRPPTPTLEDEGSETDVIFDDLENAASFIQKLLRGRAAQEEFYEGKERSIELIKELQAVEEIKRKEREQEKSHVFKEQQRRENLGQAREIVMDNIQGKLISNALDFLSKELIRQDELKRVKQLVEFAEKERRQRENEEIIRRKQEQEARKRKEKIQTETIQIHTDTVSTYLLDILNACSERLAERQAREEILHERLSDEALRERSIVTPEEGAIKDLVKCFLLPQVKREILKKKIDINQNNFAVIHTQLTPDDESNHHNTRDQHNNRSITSQNDYNYIQFLTRTGDSCINQSLSPFQIKIQVKCCGLSKLDYQVKKGNLPHWKIEKSLEINLIPGYEVSGIVIDIGKDVNSKAFSIGDSVIGFIPVQPLSKIANYFNISNQYDETNVMNNINVDSLNGGCSTECIADAHLFVKIPNGMSYIKASSSIMSGIRAYDTLFFKASSIRQGDVIFISAGARWEQTYLLQLAILLTKCRVITTVHTDEEINFLRMISSRIASSLSSNMLNSENEDSNEENERYDSNQQQQQQQQLGTSPPYENMMDSQLVSSIMSIMKNGSSANPITILDRRLYDTTEKLQQAIMKETDHQGVQAVVLGESVLHKSNSQDSLIPNERSSTTQYIDMSLNILSAHGSLILCDYTDQLTSAHLKFMFEKSITMSNCFEQGYVLSSNLIGRYLHIMSGIVKDVFEEKIEIPIAHCLPLSSIRDAHRKLDASLASNSSSSFIGKVIVKM